MKVYENVDMTVVTDKIITQPSLAMQRLYAVLEIWEREKSEASFKWLYLCARQKGQKLRSIWIAPAEISRESVEESLGDILLRATSFVVEILHSPNVRHLNPSAKNQWNSLRGKMAMEVNIGDKTARLAATDMLARNLSFSNALTRHLAVLKLKHELAKSIPVTLYQTKQWYCDNKQTSSKHKHLAPIELFRGNRVVEMEAINSDSVLRCAQAMTRWLAAQVDETGAAKYKYWPSRGAYASSNNAIRQWMATVCLGRVAQAFGSEQLAYISAKNLEHNISTTYENNGDQSYIWMNGSAKLGAAALAALAIFEAPQRKRFINEEYALNNLIHSLGNADGSFDTFYIPRERKDNQNFYSGEALLFLATRYSVSRNPEELKRIMAAFHYYRQWHLQNRNPAFVPWHTQAYFLVWKITKDNALKDFIFEMNDWLLSMQQWKSAEFPDMQGRFYDPDRSYFGPPHASSTGVYLEGLIDAFSIAKELGDQTRAENYRIAIVRGIRSLMQLQYKDAVDCFYVKHVDRVLGGVRTTVYDNTIRIDNVQHGLMALLKILNRFSDSDFTMIEKEPSSVSQKKSDIQYKHFKKMEFAIDIEAIRKEINANAHLWLENTSRQRNIKVQRETHTIFLRSAKKPFPPGVSGNDIHLSGETKNSASFPFLMQTLKKFANHVDGDLSRVTVVRLQPESRVYPHIDEGEYYKYRDRYHIVVDSPSGSEMIAGDEKIVWREGEFWWFDNKAMHEAYNKGENYRVHIIFDVLPESNKALIADEVLKQRIYSKAVSVTKRLKSDFSYDCFPACEVNLMPPIMDERQKKKYRESTFIGESYSMPKVTVEHYEDVVLVGNKFVVIDKSMQVLGTSLPTFHHKPDTEWQTRKAAYHAEVFENDILRIDEPCAVISNSNWKNYWHWHAQCVTNIQALKKADLFGKVKLLTPALNDWRLKSLYALGVKDPMLVKVRANLVRVKSLYRPTFVDKTDQPNVHPATMETFSEIRNFLTKRAHSESLKRKIYVARFDAENARPLVNEQQLVDSLRRQGYEIVTPGKLSYEKQVNLFSQASVVVGAHGAGLTNIVFCRPGALVIEIFPEYYFFDRKAAYRNHAHVGNLNYACYVSDRYVSEAHKQEAEALLGEGKQSNFPWEIDVEDFMCFLKKTAKEG